MNLVFHIGYHKTGTSWLQQVYFPAHPDIRTICNSREPWNDEFLQGLIGTSDRKFDAEECRVLLKEQIEGVREDRRDSVILVSAERLSGHPFSGGYDSLRIAERIHACAPEARIFCALRNQIDMMSSVYKQLVAEGMPGKFEDLLHARHWKGVGFAPNFYEYDRMVTKYHSLFGANRCLFVPYELMRSDISGYLGKLCEFLGVPKISAPKTNGVVNRSLPSRGLNAFRRLNYFRRTEINPFPMVTLNKYLYNGINRMLSLVYSALPPKRDILDTQQQAWIREYYHTSNGKLNRLLGYDIGYPTSG